MKKTFGEFVSDINESTEELLEKILVYKRKYGKRVDDRTIGSNAPVRTKVLGFISEKGSVSKEALTEFFDTLAEENGKKPSYGWLRRNSDYITKVVDEDGNHAYTLSKRGKKVLETHNKANS